MTKFFTFNTVNRTITIRAESEGEARMEALASVLSRIIKKYPLMDAEEFELVQTGLCIEFQNASVEVNMY